MLSDGKWGLYDFPEQVGERSEARVGGLRTKEKMKRVACRIWTTCSCTVHSVCALAIMYDRGSVIKLCRTTVSVG